MFNILLIFLVHCFINVPYSVGGNGDLQRLEEADIALTGQLVSHIYKKYPRALTVVAVYPALYVLGLSALHSSDPSYSQLLNILRLHDTEEVRNVFPKITEMITSSGDVDANLALRVYGDSCSQFDAFFAQDFQVVFDGQVRNIDFDRPSNAADTIKFWISQEAAPCDIRNNELVVTEDMISGIDMYSILFTIAYNFHGDWEYPFNPEYTKNADFDTGYGEIIQIPLMYRDGNFKYANLTDLDAQVVHFPYKGRRFSLVLVFPNEASNLSTLVEHLSDSAVLKDVINRGSEIRIQVSIPRGEICRNADLATNLNEIRDDNLILDDVERVFLTDCLANVSSIVESVNFIVHEGSGGNDYQVNIDSTVPEVKVDRAFIYYVLEKTDGIDSPVLAGVFVNPYNVIPRE